MNFIMPFTVSVSKKETVVLRNIKVGTNGGTQIVNIDIKWIDKPELLYGNVMIIFTDVKEADRHPFASKNR